MRVSWRLDLVLGFRPGFYGVGACFGCLKHRGFYRGG